MQVSIEHREATSGLFKKVTLQEVAITVQFTEEERAIIKKHRLEQAIVLEREPNAYRTKHLTQAERIQLADVFHLKVDSLLRGTDVYACDTPLEARQYDANLKDALRNLKAYLTENVDAPAGVETFEL